MIRFIQIPLLPARPGSGLRRRGVRVALSTFALAVTCATTLIASSVESPAAQSARNQDKRVQHQGDLGTARARAVAAARSLALAHPTALAPVRPKARASSHIAQHQNSLSGQ